MTDKRTPGLTLLLYVGECQGEVVGRGWGEPVLCAARHLGLGRQNPEVSFNKAFKKYFYLFTFRGEGRERNITV